MFGDLARIREVPDASEHCGLRLALACALDVLAPFVGHDLCLDADLGPVCLDQFGGAAAVRHVRACDGKCPDLRLEAIGISGLGKKALRLFEIVRMTLQVGVVPP